MPEFSLIPSFGYSEIRPFETAKCRLQLEDVEHSGTTSRIPSWDEMQTPAWRLTPERFAAER
jgi:hypothetical protein